MLIDPIKLQRFKTAGITQSAVRLGKAHQGVKGMRSAARIFCSQIKLDELPEAANYLDGLDAWTAQLQQKFPKGGRYWGVARKCLNIFMRDAAYNSYLVGMYPRLRDLEKVLEVPLDSFTAKGLLGIAGAREFGVTGWQTIIGLKPAKNHKFQQWALR